MVIVLKNRAAIYQREAAEMLHNISLYPGLTEEQLCRFFPEKRQRQKTLLAPHAEKRGAFTVPKMVATTQIKKHETMQTRTYPAASRFCSTSSIRWNTHTVAEFPAAILCFANGELYEIVPIRRAKRLMICQLLHKPQKDAGKRIVVVDDTSQIELLDIPQVAGFCTVAEDGTVSYYKKEACA